MYIINDWMGNHLFQDKVFETTDDACVFLHSMFNEDEDLQEYSVVKSEDYEEDKRTLAPIY